MANLKEVRIRMESVESTKQITNAMKMVAASKLRKSQSAILKLRPYANKLQEILNGVSSSLDNSDENIYGEKRKTEKVLLITVNSNRGLCGGFNANVIKLTEKTIKEKYQLQKDNGNLSIITIGKKAFEHFSRRDYNIIANHSGIYNNLNFSESNKIAEEIMQQFVKGDFDKIEIIYNKFKNAATHILSLEQFLPIQQNEQENKQENNINYIFEPNKRDIVINLIPKSLKIQFYKILLDSNAAENGARMTAMHKATENATELLKDLKVSYNKARQTTITNEILEITNGANALN